MKIEISKLSLGNTLKDGVVHMIGYNEGIVGCWLLESKLDSSGAKFFREKELKGIKLTEKVISSIKNLTKETPFDFIYEKHIKLSLEDGNWWSPCFDVYFKGKYLTCITHLHEFENL